MNANVKLKSKVFGTFNIFLFDLGLLGAALARAIVNREADDGGEGRGGEGQVEAGEEGDMRDMAGEIMVGEAARFGEMAGGRWRPRRARAARAWLSRNSDFD